MKRKSLVLTLMLVLLVSSSALAQVTIEYWQYYYESKVELIDELIKEFETRNPDIKVKHVTFPMIPSVSR